MIHGMGKFHGQAVLLMQPCFISVNTDMPLGMAFYLPETTLFWLAETLSILRSALKVSLFCINYSMYWLNKIKLMTLCFDIRFNDKITQKRSSLDWTNYLYAVRKVSRVNLTLLLTCKIFAIASQMILEFFLCRIPDFVKLHRLKAHYVSHLATNCSANGKGILQVTCFPFRVSFCSTFQSCPLQLAQKMRSEE